MMTMTVFYAQSAVRVISGPDDDDDGSTKCEPSELEQV